MKQPKNNTEVHKLNYTSPRPIKIALLTKTQLVPMTLDEVIRHVRDREFMSGVERDAARIKATGEVFTPTGLVQQILDSMPQELFTDPTKTFIDPACGDGQFLSEVLIRKMQNGIDFETALSTIYGVDLMDDNIRLCKTRLLCGQLDAMHIVDRNIVRADGLDYNYGFGLKPKPQKKKLNNKIKKTKKAAVSKRKNTKTDKVVAATISPETAALFGWSKNGK